MSVLIRIYGRAGRITPERPQGLDMRLTYSMCLAMKARLDAWQE